METNKKEKVLVIEETEKKEKAPEKKAATPRSSKIPKKPVSNEDNLKEKLAKASGKTVGEKQAKSKLENKNVASDYDKVMARNKALREVHEKMDKDSSPDFSAAKVELVVAAAETDQLAVDIQKEQEKIMNFEEERLKLLSSNAELQKELQEINKDRKNLDNTLNDIKVRLDEENLKIRELQNLKTDLESNLKDLSLESKNYRNIAEKSDQLIKKTEEKLLEEQNKVKELKKEITENKAQIEKLETSLETQKNEKKETISKEDLVECKALIKEKDKEIRAKERLIANRDKKIVKMTDDLKEAKKEARAAISKDKKTLKKLEKIEESLKESKKELTKANKEVTRLSNTIEQQEIDYKKAEANIGKEYTRLKNYFDQEVKNFNSKLSEKEKQEREYKNKEDATAKEYLVLKKYFDQEINDLNDRLGKKEEQQTNLKEEVENINEAKAESFEKDLKSINDKHENELLKKEIEYSEKLHDNLDAHQEDVLELQNEIEKYKDEIYKLKLIASQSDSNEAVAIMQEIKEEVVKNREVMQSIANETDDLIEDEYIDYQELIDIKENELRALEITNKQYLDEIDDILKEIAILNMTLQNLNDKINSLSEKDIHNPDFKRNISEIRERKSELIARANEEALVSEKEIANLNEKIKIKKADIESVKQQIIETKEGYQEKQNRSYSDKLEHEKELRKLNYTLDLHEVRLNELSTDEKARLKNKYQTFVEDYNKRMKEYNLSEQKFIEYYLGKTREEVITKEDEKLYIEQEQEKEELTKKLIALKQSQRLIAKKIRDLKAEIFRLKQALEEMNNQSNDDYQETKDYVLKEIELNLLQLQKDYTFYQEKLQVLYDKKAERFMVRNKLLLNEQIIFDYAKLFNHLKKTDFLYRQNQIKQKNINENLSFGKFSDNEKKLMKSDISMLDKEQERLYKSIEESREKLKSIKTHEKVVYFIELENSIARLKIIEENLGNLIKKNQSDMETKTQELEILKTGTY